MSPLRLGTPIKQQYLAIFRSRLSPSSHNEDASSHVDITSTPFVSPVYTLVSLFNSWCHPLTRDTTHVARGPARRGPLSPLDPTGAAARRRLASAWPPLPSRPVRPRRPARHPASHRSADARPRRPVRRWERCDAHQPSPQPRECPRIGNFFRLSHSRIELLTLGGSQHPMDIIFPLFPLISLWIFHSQCLVQCKYNHLRQLRGIGDPICPST